MITSANMVALTMMAVLGIALPVVGSIVWKVVTKESFKPILIGALMFLVFAIGLETIPKLFLLNYSNPVGVYILSHPLLTSLVGALLAGIFEETGRFVAYKWLLKKNTTRKTAISYGIGHGGFEVMFLLGYTGIQYLSMAFMIKSGTFYSVIQETQAVAPDKAAQLLAMPGIIASISIGSVAFSFIERLSAMMIHIACSIIMFKAVRGKKPALFALAILLHATIDMIAGLYQVGLISSIPVIEAILFIWAVALLLISVKCIYKKLPVDVAKENA